MFMFKTTNLFSILKECGVDQSAHILDAGIGGRRCRDLTALLTKLTAQPIDYLEQNAKRAQAAKHQLGERIRLFDDQIDRFYAGASYDVVYMDVLPRRLPVLFQSLLPAAVSLARVGGWVVFTVPIEINREEIAQADCDGFEAFKRSSDEKGGVQPLFKDCFAGHPQLKYIDATKPAHAPIKGFKFFSFILQKLDDCHCLKLPLNIEDVSYFMLDDVISMLDGFKAKVDFVDADQFLHYRQNKMDHRDERPIHFIKHDIHRDLLNSYRLAKAEARIQVYGSYFVMHPHELSEHYIERQETMEVLKDIQAMGHQIGVHVDALALANGPSGLMNSLANFLSDLRAAGLSIRHGNAHGNSAMRKELGLSSDLVFSEALTDARRAQLSPAALKYAGQASLKELSSKLGITGWLDTSLYLDGQRLPHSKYMIGDNYRRLSLYDLDGGTLFEGDLWQSSRALHERLLDVVSQASCLYLLHPQYYR